MAHILVTGAAGFIGSHTVDQLLASGHQVTGVDNFYTGKLSNLAKALMLPNFSFWELDIAVHGVFANLVAQTKPDAIIHLAALVNVQESIAKPNLNYLLNIYLTQLVAEAARMYSVKRVVFASSAAVYGNTSEFESILYESLETRPISPYGAAKLASEAILLGHSAAYGFTVRCQRYFNVYGPRQDPTSPYSGVISVFANHFKEGKEITIYGNGKQTRDFISVHDVASANVLAATGPDITSGIANICTGRSTTLLELIAVFARYYPVTPAIIYAPSRKGDIMHSLGAPFLATGALNFNAQISIDKGISELVQAL